MSGDESELPWFDDGDAADAPPAELEPNRQPWWLRTRWVVVGFAVLVVVGLVVGILVFNASAPDKARGARTPAAAARHYVLALNAGDRARAADAACDTFADDARAAARSGADPGISYSLGRVQKQDKDNAIAGVTQHVRVGGTTQDQPSALTLLRGSGLWLVCGRLG